jgi:CDGSH-type Zn-finger protein/uncharacterized Fe-S cluster protein YjdI
VGSVGDLKDEERSMSDKKSVYEYEGKQVDAAWDQRLCIHVGECTRAHGELFKSGRDPWGQPDRGEADYVVDVVKRCPTGALTYKRKDGGEAETPEAANRVVVANNGPLYLSGDLEVQGAAEDMPGVRFRVALCRCGQSKNKPFCDNQHEKIDFRDRGAVGESGDGCEDGGRLTVKTAPNGPLLLSGNFSIASGSASERWRGKKAALCRCGASKNKPFCDGAHKDIGFQAD